MCRPELRPAGYILYTPVLLLLEAGDLMTGGDPQLQEDTTLTEREVPLQTLTGPGKAGTTRGIVAGAEAGVPGLPGRGRQ